MPSFLNKVFGRKKDGERSPGWGSASGELLEGKFEDISPTVSPAAAHFPELQENGSPRGRGNDRMISESKLRTFFRSKSRSRAASPIRQHRKLEELPHLPLSLLANLNQDEVEVLLSDKVIGERRLTPVEAVGLVKVCSQAINKHGVDALGLMNPNWYSASPEVQRRLISLFVQSLTARSPLSTLPSFDSEINSTKSPHDVAAVLRWALRHLQLQGDSFGHQEEWYHGFFDAEHKAEYPPKAFSTTLSPLVPSEHLALLKEVLDLCSSLAPHAEANSTSGSKLSKIFGLWLLNSHRVESNDDWKSFYDRWDVAGRQLEHIFFARIRDEAVEKRMPTRLVDLVRKYPFYRDNASPTTDLRLLPRSKLSTLIYEALLVRVETEVPTEKQLPKARIHPVRIIADALSSKAEEGELSGLWTKISEVSKGEGSGTPLSRIFSDDTIRLLSLLPEEDDSGDDKSPTYSLLPLSPASPKFKRNSFSLSEFTEEMKRTHSTQSTASPLTPISSAISADWSLFSSTGFGASPTLTPLSSALFSPDVERTSPPSRKASRHGKETSRASSNRKSVEFAPTVPTGTVIEEKPVNYPSKITALQIVELDEAFVDFYQDALLDPISANWPSFVVCKLKSGVTPDLKYGPVEEGQAQKTLQWIVLEQRHAATPPPAAVPEEVVEPAHERPSSPQSISKRRFSFWSASRTNSSASIGSTKSKKKEGRRSQRASEMGEVVEEGDSTDAGTVRQSSSTRSRRRTKAEDVVKVRIPSPKPRKSGDVRSLKSVDVGPAPVVKKPVPALEEKEKKGEEVVPLAAGIAAGAAAIVATGVAVEKQKEEDLPAVPAKDESKGLEEEVAQPTEELKAEAVVLNAGEEKPKVVEELQAVEEATVVPEVAAVESKPVLESEATTAQPAGSNVEEQAVATHKEDPVAVQVEKVEEEAAPEPVLERAVPAEEAPALIVEEDLTSTIPEAVEQVEPEPIPTEPPVEAEPTPQPAPEALPIEEPAPAIPEPQVTIQQPEATIAEDIPAVAELTASPSPPVEAELEIVETPQDGLIDAPATIEEKEEVPTANGHLAEDLPPQAIPVEERVPEPAVVVEAAPLPQATAPVVEEEVGARALEPQDEGEATITEVAEAAPIASLEEQLPEEKEEDANIPLDQDLPTNLSETAAPSADETKPEATDTIVELHSNAEPGTAAVGIDDAQVVPANPVDWEAEREAEEREPRTLTTQENPVEPTTDLALAEEGAAEPIVDEAVEQAPIPEDASQDEESNVDNTISGVPHLEPLKTGDDDKSNEGVDLPAVPLTDAEIAPPEDTTEQPAGPLEEAQPEAQGAPRHLPETLGAQHLPPAIEHAFEIGSTPSAEALLGAVQSNEPPAEGDAIPRSSPPAIDVALAESLAGADDLPTAIEAAFESGLAPNPEALLNAVQATLTATVFAPGELLPSAEKKDDVASSDRAPTPAPLNGIGLHAASLHPEAKEDTPADDEPAPTVEDTEQPPPVQESVDSGPVLEIAIPPAEAAVPDTIDTQPAEQSPEPDAKAHEPTVRVIPEGGSPAFEAAAQPEDPTPLLEDQEPAAKEGAEDVVPLNEEDTPISVESPVVEEDEQEVLVVEEQATPAAEEPPLVIEEVRREVTAAVEEGPALVEKTAPVESNALAIEEGLSELVEQQIPAPTPDRGAPEFEPAAPEEPVTLEGVGAAVEHIPIVEEAVVEKGVVQGEVSAEESQQVDEIAVEGEAKPVSGDEIVEGVVEREVHSGVEEAHAPEQAAIVEQGPASTEAPGSIEELTPPLGEEGPVAVEQETPPPEEAGERGPLAEEPEPPAVEDERPAKESPRVDEEVPTPGTPPLVQEHEPEVREGSPARQDASAKEEVPSPEETLALDKDTPAEEGPIAALEETGIVAEPTPDLEESPAEEEVANLNGEAPVLEEKLVPSSEKTTQAVEVPEEERSLVVEEESVNDAPLRQGEAEGGRQSINESPVEGALVEKEDTPLVEEKTTVEAPPVVEEEHQAVEEAPVLEQATPTDDAAGQEEAQPSIDEEEAPAEEGREDAEEASIEDKLPVIQDALPADEPTPTLDEKAQVEVEEQLESSGDALVVLGEPVVEEEGGALIEEDTIVQEAPVAIEEAPVFDQAPVTEDEAPAVEEQISVDEEATVVQEVQASPKLTPAPEPEEEVPVPGETTAEEEISTVDKGPIETAERVVEEEAHEEPSTVEGEINPDATEDPVVEGSIVQEESPEQAVVEEQELAAVEGEKTEQEVGGETVPTVKQPTVDDKLVGDEEEVPLVEVEEPAVHDGEVLEERQTEDVGGAGEDEGAPIGKPVEEEASAVEEQAPVPEEALAAQGEVEEDEGPAPQESNLLVAETAPVDEPSDVGESGEPVIEEEIPAVVDGLHAEPTTPLVVEDDVPVAGGQAVVLEEVPVVEQLAKVEDDEPIAEDESPVEGTHPTDEGQVEDFGAQEKLISEGDDLAVGGTPSPKEPLLDEDGPVVQNSQLPVDNIPLVEDVVPVVEETLPVVEEDIPVTVQEEDAPIVEEGGPVIAEQPPSPVLEEDVEGVEVTQDIIASNSVQEAILSIDSNVTQPQVINAEGVSPAVDGGSSATPATEEETTFVEDGALTEEEPKSVSIEEVTPIAEPAAADEPSEANAVSHVAEEKERSPLVETEDLPEDTPLTTVPEPKVLPTEDEPPIADAPTAPPQNPQIEQPEEAQPKPIAEEPPLPEQVSPTIIDKLSTPLVEEDDDPTEVNESKPPAVITEEATTTPNA